MKRWMIPMALIAVIGLGSYAIFAQQAANPPQQRGVGGGMGRGMTQGGGPMGGMGCPGCAAACGAMMQQSVAATNDGGVIVATAGKVTKYDAGLKKVGEANIDIDWTVVHQRMQQMMQNCPMMQQMMKQPAAPPAGQKTP